MVNFELNYAALPTKWIRAIVQANDTSAMEEMEKRVAQDDTSPNSGKQYFFHISGTHACASSHIWAVL